MPIVTVNQGRSSLTGAPVGLEDDNGDVLVDDNGVPLVDDLPDFGTLLNAVDDDGTGLVDDDGTPLTDDPPHSRVPVTQWLQAVGARLTLQDGTDFRLRGVNWAGFESRMFPGMLTQRAYRTIVVDGVVKQGLIDQMAQLGLNSIRLPICIDMTWDGAECMAYDGISVTLNPDLVIADRVPPGVDGANGTMLLPPLEILDKVVAYAKSLGMRILLDMHCSAPNTDNATGFNGRWYTSTGPNGPAGTTFGLTHDPRNEQSLIDAWVVLAKRYANEPAVCAFEIVNEPWDTTWDDDPMTGLPAFYERVGNAIQAVNSDVLIVCEGNLITSSSLPNYKNKYGSWPGWGQNLFNVHFRPVKLNVRQDKLCYAPHDYYGSGYDWTQSYAFPETMVDVWDTLWGYIVAQDIAPIVITEWGGNFSANAPAQVKWAYRFLEYMRNEMGGKVNWFHWAMVPGTDNTGADQTVVGLVNQGPGPDDANTLWPDQANMVRLFVAASQDA
jgi:endoglucanase